MGHKGDFISERLATRQCLNVNVSSLHVSDHGAEVNAMNSCRATALHDAVFSGVQRCTGRAVAQWC